MSEFFHMGGYAGFIWSAYGISAVVLSGLVILSLRSYRQSNEQVISLEENDPVYQAKKATAASSAAKSTADTASA
jgi:heme exporter protein D